MTLRTTFITSIHFNQGCYTRIKLGSAAEDGPLSTILLRPIIRIPDGLLSMKKIMEKYEDAMSLESRAPFVYAAKVRADVNDVLHESSPEDSGDSLRSI